MLPLALFAILYSISSAFADNADLAWRIFKRLNGANPSPTELASLKSALDNGQGIEGAARIAVENRGFINGLVRNYAAISINRNQSLFWDEALGDGTFAIMWNVKQGMDFRRILDGDVGAWPNPALLNTLFYPAEGPVDVSGPNYRYQDRGGGLVMEVNNVSFADVLIEAPLMTYPTSSESHPSFAPSEVDAEDRSPVLSSRTWAKETLNKGTNRRAVKQALSAFLCKDIAKERQGSFRENTTIIGQVHRDLTRSNSNFLSVCITCHGALDPMAKAFVYTNYASSGFVAFTRRDRGRLGIDPPVSTPKELMRKNAGTGGTDPTNANWTNNLPNEGFGWKEGVPLSGNGLKSFGHMLAESDAFASCAAERFYKLICKRGPNEVLLRSLTDAFKGSLNYRIKALAAKIISTEGCIQ